MTTLLSAIRDYLDASRAAVSRLEDVAGYANLMSAWREGLLHQSAVIDGVAYEFHGSGVYIEVKSDNLAVDVDFGRGGQLGGFDSWRIWQWIKSNPKRYPGFESHQLVRDGLKRLIASSEVREMEGSSLLYLCGAEFPRQS